MDINAILTNSETDVEHVRLALINVKGSLQVASHDYANAALGAANEVMKLVQDGAPSVAVWPHIVDYCKYAQRAQDALQATTQATGMLLMAEETGDAYTDDINSDVKVASIEVHVISSMLEGAATRMNLALQGVPQNGAPGARCNPNAVVQSNPPED